MDTFRRSELKYLCSDEEAEQFYRKIQEHIHPDLYYQYTVHSVYLDNDQNMFAIYSLNHPKYKAKLRLRSYSNPLKDDIVYLELKKKWNGIVYKNRIELTYRQAMDYLDYNVSLSVSNGTTREIDYLLKYANPEQRVTLLYDRTCWQGKDEEDLRITFDRRIRYRMNDISLVETGLEKELLKNQVMMEIKAEYRYPLWLVHALREMNFKPVSFSKYGNVYRRNFTAFQGGISENV